MAEVERAIRCLKGNDLLVRPIRHRTEEGVRAHILLCLLAYCVEWGAAATAKIGRRPSADVFEDEGRRDERQRHDPILPAKPSASAEAKRRSFPTVEGLAVHSFSTLLAGLASRARVTYEFKSAEAKLNFKQVREPAPLQGRSYELIRLSPLPRRSV